jgi:hypothetical protein
VLIAACGSSGGAVSDGGGGGDGADAPVDLATPPATNRDRLLGSYLDYLHAHPGAQINGLDGAHLTGVCDLWSQLVPSAQAVFLTLTARLDGSVMRRDATPMLDHVTTLYWLAGGSGATATDAGTCGGSGNRMILSIDPTLHGELTTSYARQGGPSGSRVIDDVVPTSFWRDSHDAGGPHAPFDQSNETEGGAPRGQVQYFKDPASTLATSPLGRLDLMSLVDPYAFEIDQDYDCVHASNPLCSYTYYGALCAPAPTKLGVEIYAETYGAIDLGWKPAGC